MCHCASEHEKTVTTTTISKRNHRLRRVPTKNLHPQKERKEGRKPDEEGRKERGKEGRFLSSCEMISGNQIYEI
jgi:hypothetical protein